MTYTDEAWSQGYLNQPGIANDAQARAWRPVVERVHAAGGTLTTGAGPDGFTVDARFPISRDQGDA